MNRRTAMASPNIDIQTDSILSVLKQQLNNTFSLLPYENTYNCCTFILGLLIKMNIIPEINIDYYLPDHFHYLKTLSDGKYHESFIIKNNI